MTPQLYPLLWGSYLSALSWESLSAAGISHCIVFLLSAAFWGDNGIMLVWILTALIPTSRILWSDHGSWPCFFPLWNMSLSISFNNSVYIKNNSTNNYTAEQIPVISFTLQTAWWYVVPINKLHILQYTTYSLSGLLWLSGVLSCLIVRNKGTEKKSIHRKSPTDIKSRPPKPIKYPVCKTSPSFFWQVTSVEGILLVLLKGSWHTYLKD